MRAHTASPCLAVADVAPFRDFLVEQFGARVIFDCGWYVNLSLGEAGATLQFMTPPGAGARLDGLAGITLNFDVDDVDAEHARLRARGLPEAMALDDHPWGDRGFAVAGPGGLLLYVYSPRPPSPEFAEFFR